MAKEDRQTAVNTRHNNNNKKDDDYDDEDEHDDVDDDDENDCDDDAISVRKQGCLMERKECAVGAVGTKGGRKEEKGEKKAGFMWLCEGG